jgi:hypothetical protein
MSWVEMLSGRDIQTMTRQGVQWIERVLSDVASVWDQV